MDSIHGVGIYVSSNLDASEVHFYDFTFIEYIWVIIQLHGNDMITILSPSLCIGQTTSDSCDLLSRSNHCLVCGNFNYQYGNIDWANHSKLTPVNAHVQKFLDTLNDFFWTQHVAEPTRYSISSYFRLSPSE